jgi:hypothetical protein
MPGGTTVPNAKSPYLKVVDDPRSTKGKGSTQPTIFGVIGRTKMDPYQASLQNLVLGTKASAGVPSDLKSAGKLLHHHENTERHIIGQPPATHIPGMHYGQVPYPGYFMSAC